MAREEYRRAPLRNFVLIFVGPSPAKNATDHIEKGLVVAGLSQGVDLASQQFWPDAVVKLPQVGVDDYHAKILAEVPFRIAGKWLRHRFRTRQKAPIILKVTSVKFCRTPTMMQFRVVCVAKQPVAVGNYRLPVL